MRSRIGARQRKHVWCGRLPSPELLVVIEPQCNGRWELSWIWDHALVLRAGIGCLFPKRNQLRSPIRADVLAHGQPSCEVRRQFPRIRTSSCLRDGHACDSTQHQGEAAPRTLFSRGPSKLHSPGLRSKINHQRTNAQHRRRQDSHRLRVREAFTEHRLDVTDCRSD